MGYLLIDHRSTVDPTGARDGKLQEFDTVSCPHCQAVLKIEVTGPCRKRVKSLGECDYCKRPVCDACAARLMASEVCPGEMRERVDRAWQRMRSESTLFLSMRR